MDSILARLVVPQKGVLHLRAVGIKELKTTHGKPIDIASAFDAGDPSLGKVARVFDKSKKETMRKLSHLGIAIADYDLEQDLKTLRL